MTRFGLWCALLAMPMTSLEAQWEVGLRVGIARYFGATRSASGNPNDGAVRPFRPTTVGAQIGHNWGGVRVEMAFEYGAPGLAVEVPGGKLIAPDEATYYALEPEVTVRMVRLGTGVVRAGAAPVLTLWNVSGFDQRFLVGGEAVATYEWPVVAHLVGAIRLGLSLSPSVFQASDVPPDFERRMMVRPSISFGVRYH
jgi:hypothetical protein